MFDNIEFASQERRRDGRAWDGVSPSQSILKIKSDACSLTRPGASVTGVFCYPDAIDIIGNKPNPEFGHRLTLINTDL